MSLGIRHIALSCCALALVACGSSVDPDDDGDAATGASPSADAGGPGAQDTKGAGRKRRGTKAEDPAPSKRNADGSPVEVTGDELCGDVPPAAASSALGVEVDDALPGDTATPQCTYSYTNADGNDSTFTLAAMRPVDIGGRTGIEAFDYMVDLSRGLAGPVSLDQQDLPVGDKAVRITGGDLHTGVLAAGGHLLTVTVPQADADPAEVDALVTTVARALA